MIPAEQVEQKLSFSLLKVGFARLIKRITIIKECSLPASKSACAVVGMETTPAPTNKTDPCDEATEVVVVVVVGTRPETKSQMGTVASSEHFWHSSAPDSSSRTFYRGSGRSGRGPPKLKAPGSPRKQRSLLIGHSCAETGTPSNRKEPIQTCIQDIDRQDYSST